MQTPPDRFAPGDTVTIKDSGLQAKVVMKLTTAPFARPAYLVDHPHGNGTMRRSFREEELQ